VKAENDFVGKIKAEVAKIIVGQEALIDRILISYLSDGHILLEGLPGLAKTLTIRAFSRAIDTGFRRVQFTPDLLPSDLTGNLTLRDRELVFRPGPVFTNVLLADEINRASPRTQSALLEAMAEGQVSVEGERRVLHELFFVVATQNPIEFRGTYPLPEAQMDRFALQLDLGYLAPEDEAAVLEAQMHDHPLDRVEACATVADVLELRRAVRGVRVSDEMRRYIVALVAATRKTAGVRLGASPRASLSLMKSSQALALFDGLDCVTPDQVQEIAVPTLAHRLVLDPQAQYSGQSQRGVVEDILRHVPVPA